MTALTNVETLVDRQGACTAEGTDGRPRPPMLIHSYTEKVLMMASTNAEFLVDQECTKRCALKAETGKIRTLW